MHALTEFIRTLKREKKIENNNLLANDNNYKNNSKFSPL